MGIQKTIYYILLLAFCLCSTSVFAQSKLTYLEKNLKDAQKSKSKESITSAYLAIGDYYLDTKEFKKANKNYKKALDKSEDSKYPEGIASSKNSIGLYYVALEDYENAIKTFDVALKVAQANNLGSLSREISANSKMASDNLALQKKINEKYNNMKSMKKEDVVRLMEEEKAKLKEQEAQQKKEEALRKANEIKIKRISSQSSAFLDKIKNLSTENQLIAMRLEITNQEVERNKMAIEKSNMEIEILNNERKMKNMLIAKKDAEKEKLQTFIWSIVIVCGVLAILVFIIFRGYRQKKKTNELLLSKNKTIEEKSKKIMDSILYAKKIQEAILTPPDLIHQVLSDHFVLYKPKDIVSGDFYWAYKIHNKYAIWMVADCTGHGVPGAFMSMIGNSLLNEIIIERNIISADTILDELKISIIKALGQAGATGEVRDGMDAALCVWNKETNILEFAGAFNPLYLVRDGELQSIDADRKPVGWHFAYENSPFTKKEIKLNKGDSLYLFSDGYMDQFGGENGKKFSRQRFKDLLISISEDDVLSQKNSLDKTLEEWRLQANEDQVDDICVIGVKV